MAPFDPPFGPFGTGSLWVAALVVSFVHFGAVVCGPYILLLLDMDATRYPGSTFSVRGRWCQIRGLVDLWYDIFHSTTIVVAALCHIAIDKGD